MEAYEALFLLKEIDSIKHLWLRYQTLLTTIFFSFLGSPRKYPVYTHLDTDT